MSQLIANSKLIKYTFACKLQSENNTKILFSGRLTGLCFLGA